MQDARIKEDKKLDIVKRAYNSFYDGGFHATGVDAVMADSGISKRTLYKYFGSKEDLIQAVLDYYATQISEELFSAAQAASDDPRAQILAFFDIREQLIVSRPIRGCLGIKASQEYVGKHNGIAASGKAFAEFVEGNFVRLCGEAGFEKPGQLGKEITILFQGAVLLAQVYGNPSPFETAKVATLALMAIADPAKTRSAA
jgi:AcrR family transcriptional regulator